MREKENYRDNIAAIKEAYPGAQTLTIKEVADYLSVDRRKVKKMIVRGELKAIDLNQNGKNKQYRVRIEALAKL
jgi:excisionase family DNA binding protein